MKLTAYERDSLLDRNEEPAKREAHFNRLVELQPQLLTLLEQARGVKKDHDRFREHFSEYELFHENLKRQVSQMVGHLVMGPDELRTSGAYETVYEIIYAAIPACRCRGCS